MNENNSVFFPENFCYNETKLKENPSKISKEIEAMAKLVVATAEDHKAISLKLLNLQGQCDYADYFVVMSATSIRHAQSMADAILSVRKTKSDDLEGYQTGDWILIDLGDIVVHIFQESTREHYNLDKLWGNTPLKAPTKKRAATQSLPA